MLKIGYFFQENSKKKEKKRKKNSEHKVSFFQLLCRIVEMFRSALVCLRGSRSIKPKIFDISSEEIQNSSAYVVSEEAKLQ